MKAKILNLNGIKIPITYVNNIAYSFIVSQQISNYKNKLGYYAYAINIGTQKTIVEAFIPLKKLVGIKTNDLEKLRNKYKQILIKKLNSVTKCKIT